MDESLKQIIEETFASKAQQRLFFAKGKNSKKWKKWAEEFASKTDFSELPDRKKKKRRKKIKDVDEIVDKDGNIQKGDLPTNFATKGVTSKKTSDDFARAVGGQMGGAGLDGGGNAARLMRYFGESDMSKSLGYEETLGQDEDYDDAKEYFEDELDLPEDETEERLEKMGYDDTYPRGKVRLVENPKKFIEEYVENILSKRSKMNDMVEKNDDEEKDINPIIKKQISVLKQTIKDNGISTKQFLRYLKDNE